MRVEDYLRYRARLKGAAPARVGAALQAAHALDVARRRIGQLSKGYRQRVGLADALVADPPILVLDEPTAGLDPNQIREVRDLVRDLARERTVLLSTHILSEVEALAARVVVLRAGRVVAAGALDELRQAARGTRVVVAPADEAAAVQVVDGRAVAPGVVTTSLDASEAARRLVAAGVAIRELGPEIRSLEDVFHGLTA
jgi:ABC-2 type transport system ATP-binding protein